MKVGDRNLTLVVTAMTLALAYGVWYSYSVFLVALLREFGWSRSVLAGAFSVFTLVHGAVNPLVGMLCDRVGPRRMVMTGGVMLGLALMSNSLIDSPWLLYLCFGTLTAVSVAFSGWVPAVVLMQRQFTDRIGLALGIVSSGVGVGILVVVPMCQLLIEHLGWRTAYQVLGLICIGWILPATWYLVRDKALPVKGAPAPGAQPRAGGNAPAGNARDVTLATALRSWPFWLIVGAFFFGNFCAQTLHVHQVAFLVDHGIPALVAATVVGVVGASSIVGKTGGGWLSDRVDRELIYMAGIGIMIVAVGVLWMVGATPSYRGAYMYAVLLGLGYSVTAALVPAMMSDRFKGRHFGTIFGVCHLSSASGSAVGPWFAGRLFDTTGSYTVPFVLCAISAAIAGAAAWMARGLRRRTMISGDEL